MSRFWMVGLETDTPWSFSCWLKRTQPHMGCSAESASTFATTSGGVVMGWDLWMGGRSRKPSSPCVWNLRLYS